MNLPIDPLRRRRLSIWHHIQAQDEIRPDAQTLNSNSDNGHGMPDTLAVADILSSGFAEQFAQIHRERKYNDRTVMFIGKHIKRRKVA